MDNGRELKELRRLSHRVLTTDALRKHTTVHQALVEDYMRTLVQEPDNFLTNLRLCVTSGSQVLITHHNAWRLIPFTELWVAWSWLLHTV